ncbi:hypothetical protein CMP1-71 [Clavibacter phage CMP1]|uniref:Uncharacterized protein n=1 Tax=Clavibacter phage CMP1 TaxID=686439 RepID=D0U255_9CAUD|nr:hypothetical protein CMP1-71 [Clavibacter phage CMP1]ACY35963.1 hypothetical protein CMP1-71 [Clavibacter phage CMP1]
MARERIESYWRMGTLLDVEWEPDGCISRADAAFARGERFRAGHERARRAERWDTCRDLAAAALAAFDEAERVHKEHNAHMVPIRLRTRLRRWWRGAL